MDPQPNPAQTPVQPVTPAQPPQPPTVGSKTNAMAIVALVCAFILPVLGFILALVALSQIKKSGEKGHGVAVSAVIISIVMFILVGLLLVLLGLGTIGAVQKASTDTTSSTTTTSTQSKNYSADEQKAVNTSEAFLSALKSGDYNAAYNLMGPELKKQYKDANDFSTQAKDKHLDLIKSWSVTSVTTNSTGDTITVKGTAKASSQNGTFEFSYYKDTDGSINMLSYELSF